MERGTLDLSLVKNRPGASAPGTYLLGRILEPVSIILVKKNYRSRIFIHI